MNSALRLLLTFYILTIRAIAKLNKARSEVRLACIWHQAVSTAALAEYAVQAYDVYTQSNSDVYLQVTVGLYSIAMGNVGLESLTKSNTIMSVYRCVGTDKEQQRKPRFS